MPFVKRNPAGDIVAVSQSAADDFPEELPAGDAVLKAFLHDLQPATPSIENTDMGFIRVLEDVIDVLVEKQVFDLNELPEDARDKIFLRRRLRGELRGGS